MRTCLKCASDGNREKKKKREVLKELNPTKLQKQGIGYGVKYVTPISLIGGRNQVGGG